MEIIIFLAFLASGLSDPTALVPLAALLGLGAWRFYRRAPKRHPSDFTHEINPGQVCARALLEPRPSFEPSEQWHRDIAANRRVEQWARRERDFEQIIEDIRAGRRP